MNDVADATSAISGDCTETPRLIYLIDLGMMSLTGANETGECLRQIKCARKMRGSMLAIIIAPYYIWRFLSVHIYLVNIIYHM